MKIFDKLKAAFKAPQEDKPDCSSSSPNGERVSFTDLYDLFINEGYSESVARSGALAAMEQVRLSRMTASKEGSKAPQENCFGGNSSSFTVGDRTICYDTKETSKWIDPPK